MDDPWLIVMSDTNYVYTADPVRVKDHGSRWFSEDITHAKLFPTKRKAEDFIKKHSPRTDMQYQFLFLCDPVRKSELLMRMVQ